jgi:UDP:flavonoid glycosyltransferase YjiC (YdhE family)
VYVSFGSQIYHQPQLFRLLAEATKNLGAQVVFAAQQLHQSPEFADLPAHVLTCGYAPQLALLPRASVFVTHGGANSVMEAIRFGVPLLISPICNDQFHQAHYIQRRAIGEAMDLYDTSVQMCHEVLKRLLHAPDYRRNLEPITRSYQRDGAREAARLIERLA